MTLITILNIVGCLAVIAVVVAPLACAIVTQHRNDPPALAARLTTQRPLQPEEPPLQPHPSRDHRPSRPERRPAYSAG